MRHVRSGTHDGFPEFGARARMWRRFENAFTGWLETPEGQFARWRALRALTCDVTIERIRADVEGPADAVDIALPDTGERPH
jgi:hypothetical protein